MVPEKILNYKINRLIGEGGMAKVYEADLDSSLGTKVAIKVLDRHLATEESLKKRFRQEAKSMLQLKHPYIINVLNFIEEEDTLAIVMEYIDGVTLKEMVEKDGPVEPELAKQIFIEILEAMQYVHDKGMIHRDIKPSNIFIIEGKYPKILDFGIVKVFGGEESNKTKTGLTIGTPMYMSPEQIQTPQNIDYRTDIYSLGVTLHYMMAGNPPFDPTGSEYIIQSKVVQETLPTLTGVPGNILKAISKATEKERTNRFQSCNEFKQILSSDMKTESQVTQIINEPVTKEKVIEKPTVDKKQTKKETFSPPPIPENTSGMGASSKIPTEIDKWNWGAFFLNWIWGLGNSAFLALLCLIPFVNIVMIFVVGVNGNKWAWRGKKWDSIEHFKSVQKKWTQWGVGIFIANIVIAVILIIISASIAHSSSDDYDYYDDYSTTEEPAVVEEADSFTTIYINDLYSLDIPDFMDKMYNLNDDASLQYGQVYEELYTIVIDEPISDVELYADINSLSEYGNFVFDGIEYNLSNTSTSQTQYANINGHGAKIKEISGNIDGISVFYLIGVIEGDDHYYQVYTWTIKENLYTHKDKMYDILNSFKEI